MDQRSAGLPGDLTAQIDAEVERLMPWLVEVRHHLHRHPELSWQEHETAAFLAGELDAHGVPHRCGAAETGIIADIPGNMAGGDGRLTAYRADMDALALTEANPVDYASQTPGVMHACGHDLHMAVALGVARALMSFRDRMGDGVRVIFQPAEEEVPAGSAAMIDAGALEDVSSIFAVHCEPALPAGHIGVRYGAVTASADRFDLLITGRSGHSSRPFMAVDAILIATKVTEAIYQLTGQHVDPFESAVINVGTIAGGDAANVICGHVRMSGAIRCFDNDLRGRLEEWLRDMAGGITHAMGGDFELEVHRGAPPLINATELVDDAHAAALDVVGPDAVTLIERPSMGGEDFSWYADKVDGALIRIGTHAPGHEAQLHNEHFDAGDSPIAPITKVMLRTLLARAAKR